MSPTSRWRVLPASVFFAVLAVAALGFAVSGGPFNGGDVIVEAQAPPATPVRAYYNTDNKIILYWGNPDDSNWGDSFAETEAYVARWRLSGATSWESRLATALGASAGSPALAIQPAGISTTQRQTYQVQLWRSTPTVVSACLSASDTLLSDFCQQVGSTLRVNTGPPFPQLFIIGQQALPPANSVQCTNITENSFGLRIFGSDDTRYFWYRIRDSGSAWTYAGSLTWSEEESTFKTLTITGLTSGTTYDVTDGTRTASSGRLGWNCTTTQAQRPATLTGLSASGITATGATLTASLTNPDSASTTVYLRYRRTGTTSWTSRSTITTTASATFTLTSLTTDSAYEAQASLVSNFPSGGRQSTSFTPVRPPRPATLTGLSASGITETGATLTASLSNPDSVSTTVYVRYRRTGTTSWTTRNAVTTTTSATFTLSGLTTDSAYEAQASLVSNFPSSGRQSTSFTPTRPPRPATLTGLSASGITETGATLTASLTNLDSVSTTVYVRYRRSGTVSWTTRNAVTTSISATFTLSGLTTGSAYEAQASLVSNFPSSGRQSTSFTPVRAATLTGLSAANIADTTAQITASLTNPDSVNTTVYLRYRRTGTSTWTTNASATTGTESIFSLSSLTQGAAYEAQASLVSNFPSAGRQSTSFTTQRTATITGIAASSIGFETATLTIAITNPDSISKEVFIRYRRVGDTTWITSSVTTSQTSVDIELSGLVMSTRYEAQASFASNFPVGFRLTSFTTFTRRLAALTSLAADNIATTTARLTVSLNNPDSASTTVYVRYREAGTGQAWSTQNATTTSATAVFDLSGLKPNKGYDAQASLSSSFPDGFRTASFNTLARTASLTGLAAGGVGTTTATLNASLSNPDSRSTTVYLRYRPTGTSNWTTANTSTSSSTATFTLTALANNRAYEAQASLSSTFPAAGRQSVTFMTVSIPVCTAQNNPPVDLGTLPTTANATLPPRSAHRSNIPTELGNIPCVDGDGRASNYFSFTLGTGGGVLLLASADGSEVGHLTPDIRILPSIGGTPTFDNAARSDNVANLGMVLQPGTYIAQVRSTLSIDSDSAARGGPYDFSVKRIYPLFSTLLFSNDELNATIDVGALSPNMAVSMDYKRDTATNWTRAATNLTNQEVNGIRTQFVMVSVDQLESNRGYDVRAQFQHGDNQFTTSAGFTTNTVAFPSPPRPSLDPPTYSMAGEPFSVRVLANWEYPRIEMSGGGSGSTWFWEIDWGGEHLPSSQSLQAATTFFADDLGKTINIRVRGIFRCVDNQDATIEPCKVYIEDSTLFSNAEDRWEIPEGATWYTGWSDSNVFIVRSDDREIPTALDTSPEPLPAFTEAIDSILGTLGVQEDSRRPAIWSFFLCFVIAAGAGAGLFYVTGGPNNPWWPAFLGAIVFFLIYAIAGPQWFGVPPLFAYSTIIVPIMLLAIIGLGKVRT